MNGSELTMVVNLVSLKGFAYLILQLRMKLGSEVSSLGGG